MDKIEVNKYGVNKLINCHILSYEKMKEIGFNKNYYEGTDHEEYSPYWWFTKSIEFPKDKEYRYVDIDFTVKIPKDNSDDINIMVLDMDFCQPFDYQYILNKNPNNECSNIIKEQVEEWMQYLQDNGVISGYTKGMYI